MTIFSGLAGDASWESVLRLSEISDDTNVTIMPLFQSASPQNCPEKYDPLRLHPASRFVSMPKSVSRRPYSTSTCMHAFIYIYPYHLITHAIDAR